MAGMSIEETLELWASSLRTVNARMRPLFLQERMAASAGLFLDGLVGGYASRHGHAFVDRALYLPKAWTDDPARMAAAHVPEEIRFAAKPKLAEAMIERALAAEMPFAWVAADTVYGTGDVEMALRRAGKGYVLGTNANHLYRSWGKKQRVSGTAEAIACELPETAWIRLSAGEGIKGARLHDWHYLELADLDARACDGPPGSWTRGLLVRRHVADGSMAFFSTWCPLGTSLETLVAVEGRRWTIEDAFETDSDGWFTASFVLIVSAVAVQTKGLGLLLVAAM